MWKNLPTDADDAKQQFPSQWGLKFGGMDFVASKLHPMAVQRLDMKIEEAAVLRKNIDSIEEAIRDQDLGL